ncbi:MAG: cytochrome ubiquinol oxidase subunit I, partial [Parvularculaceae bacterium]
AAIVAPIQIVVGDMHGLNTLEHQPAKIAAIEGHFETQKGAPLILFGIPDMEAEETKYALEIPKLGSLLLTHHLDGEVIGLKEFAKEDRPNSFIVFWAFRIMVGLGTLMAFTGLLSLWLRWRNKLYSARLFHRLVVAMAPSGFIAVIAGWTVTEVGRQPYTVYGLLRTSQSVSPIETPAVATSLLIFIIVYFVVFGFGIYYILRMMMAPPSPGQSPLASEHPIGLDSVISSKIGLEDKS